MSPSGKAAGFDPAIRRFESSHPSHSRRLAGDDAEIQHPVRGSDSRKNKSCGSEFFPDFPSFTPIQGDNPNAAVLNGLFPGRPASIPTRAEHRLYLLQSGRTAFTGFGGTTAGVYRFNQPLGLKHKVTDTGLLTQNWLGEQLVFPIDRSNIFARGDYEINEWVRASRANPAGEWQLFQYLNFADRTARTDVFTYNMLVGLQAGCPVTGRGTSTRPKASPRPTRTRPASRRSSAIARSSARRTGARVARRVAMRHRAASAPPPRRARAA